jgi:predicted phage tail protein
VAGTGGQTIYYWEASNGATGSTPGTTTGQITGLGAGSYTVQVYAQNTGGKFSTTATSNAGAITAQAIPSAPGQPNTAVNSGTTPGSITWSWGGVSASPGGTDHLSYEVSLNGGAPVNIGAVTSYNRSGLGAGTYTLTVRAVNKAGASGWSPGGSGSIVEPSNSTITNNTCAYDVHEFDVNKRLVCVANVAGGTRLEVEFCSKQLNLIQYHRVMRGPLVGTVVPHADIALDGAYPGTCQY